MMGRKQKQKTGFHKFFCVEVLTILALYLLSAVDLILLGAIQAYFISFFVLFLILYSWFVLTIFYMAGRRHMNTERKPDIFLVKAGVVVAALNFITIFVLTWDCLLWKCVAWKWIYTDTWHQMLVGDGTLLLGGVYLSWGILLWISYLLLHRKKHSLFF